VEVLSGGFWGPVCASMWEMEAANVVCRQLGHEKALGAPRNEQEYVGICLGNVLCTGNESSVLGCEIGEWITGHSYEESSVASAVCSPTGNLFY